MSNYTKSFNFRNGVQVDDSSLVVNAAGLVGVGTTRPEKRLDVFGNARVSGISSLSTVNVTNVVTIGAGITLDATSGIITATKFVGDASGLQNIVAIATDGWLSNAGTLSTVGKVGIGTTTVNNQLDVKGNSKFVGDTTFDGLIVSKNIDAVGIITATKFAGAGGTAAPFVSINVGTAATVGILTVNNTSTFNNDVSLPDDKKLKFGSPDGLEIYHSQNLAGTNDSYIDSSARNLFVRLNTGTDNGGNIALQAKKDEHGILIEDDGSVKLYFDGNQKFETTGAGVTVTGDLGVNQQAILNNLYVSGISTFNENLNLNKVSVGATVGFAKSIFMATNASIFLGDSENLKIFNSGTDSFVINNTGVLDIRSDNNITLYDKAGNKKSAEFDTDGSVNLFHNNVSKFQTITTGTKSFGEVQVARLNGGTNNLSTLYGSLRYGNENSISFPYSTRKSLDLLNYDRGEINFYLNASNTGLTPKPFYQWHYGLNNRIMTLTGDGNLGIGITLPVHPLHVSGIATVSSHLYVGDSITGIGSVTASSFYGGLTGDVTGDLTGNVSATTGTSTFFNIRVNEKDTQFAGIGVGKNCAASNIIDAVGGDGLYSSRLFVTTDGNIGIMTDVIDDTININALQAKATLGSVGVGTTNPLSAIDFRDAGKDQPSTIDGNPNPAFGRMYMYPPKITETQRNNLVGVTNGAIIFNTTADNNNGKLQVRAGGNWVDLH